MKLDEVIISRGILKTYLEELYEYLDTEVAIVGAGPSGLVAGYYLAREKIKVAIFDQKLAPGGGMWGGGMMFNKIIVQEKSLRILDDFDIRYTQYEPGYYVADSIEAISSLLKKTISAGAKLFNLVSAEDLMVHKERVTGLVLNWTPVTAMKLHVDPLVLRARYVIDSTGHPAEMLSVLSRKMGVKLNTPSGGVSGEKAMNALAGEEDVVKNTAEVYPGIYVTGMAANAAFGSHRMGPIFGGMLLSGEKAAVEIAKALKREA